MPSLAALALGCTPEVSLQDSRMREALVQLEGKTSDLTAEFEATVMAAAASGETFKELGSSTGEVVMVDGDQSYGCIPSQKGDGIVCERSGFSTVEKDPSLVTLDRKKSTLLYAATGPEMAVQMVSHPTPDQQVTSTISLIDKACVLHNTGNGLDASLQSSDPEIVKECQSLRDGLMARLKKVMETALQIKKS